MIRRSTSLSTVVERLRAEGLADEAPSAEDVVVHGVSQDSRTVRPGDLFLAWAGTEFDSHAFLPQAAAAGCVAAVVEHADPEVDLPQVQVTSGRRAAAIAADAVMGSPWENVFMAGVTGTNGKSTTAFLARHILNRKGPAAAIGTLGLVEHHGSPREGTVGLTTPGPAQVSTWLRELVDDGYESIMLEASSHALHQHRLDGVRFDAAVFTNLTQDHLDYHGSLESYRDAKVRMTKLLKDDGVVVVNDDDPAWVDLAHGGHATLTFGHASTADLRADRRRAHDGGTDFRLVHGEDNADVTLPLLGSFNVENALAAAAVGLVAGMSLDAVAGSLSEAPQIPGRLERVVREPFPVVIDFAHTPDALERVLQTLKPLTEGRLIVVFGAGGDRDTTKRPLMGAAAARHAETLVVTSDNPRTENPEDIVAEVVSGITHSGFHQIVDREEAIRHALGLAQPGDLVLLAGKGHETYQVVGTEKRPFDERSVVNAYFEARGEASAT